jgi:hypothetical protein
MFESYRFDNHSTDQAIVLGGSSYVWSALGGPLYVLAYGFKLAAAAMVGFTALLAIAAFVAITVAVGLFDSAMSNVFATAGITAVAFVAQGVIGVRVVRSSLIRRGWREWY